MKRIFLFTLILISTFRIFSTEVPQLLYGIWEGKDRYVFFEKSEEENQVQAVIYLKDYYGWHLDRTAEPDNYANQNPRWRNNSTPRKAIKILMDFNAINKNTYLYYNNDESTWDNDPVLVDFSNYDSFPQISDLPVSVSNAFEIEMIYSKFQKNKIPVAILDDCLYLNFYVQDSENQNYYRGNMNSRGLLVSEQPEDQNIGCLYIDQENNKFFDIRYWLTDMDFDSDSKINFKKDEYSFYVNRHLKSADLIYTCVSGRSRKIRNPMDPFNLSEMNYLMSKDNSLLISDKEPFLRRLADKETLNDLFNIVWKINTTRKPDPPPQFPPKSLEWHWDLIEMLEKDNTIIQEVRKRQLEFRTKG